MAIANGGCPQCGFRHRTRADALACDAIHGQVRTWPDVRDPRALCALCGYEDRLSELLWHFKEAHGHSTIRRGDLVRFILETDPL